MINKLQNGGAVNEEQEAFTAYLIKIINPKDAKDFEDTLQKMSAEEIKELYKQFKSMKQITLAKLGAKLNYIQELRGTCPDGYEVEKFMSGGCVKCKKKAQGSTIDTIKKEMKCGGKMGKRKIAKKESGDRVKKLGPGDSTSVGSIKPNKNQTKAMK